MADNKYRAEASLEVGGVKYHLQMDTNAIAELEAIFKVRGKLAVFARVCDGSITGVRGGLYACALAHHKFFTIEDAGRLLDDAVAFERSRILLIEMIENAFPPLKGKLMPDPLEPQTSPATTPAATAKRPKRSRTRSTSSGS